MTRVLLTISSAKNTPGVRSIVFHAAVGGVYNNQTGTHESSMFYVGNDLQVNLLFQRLEKAGEFLNKVKQDLKYFKLTNCVVTNAQFQEAIIHGSLNAVDLEHYVNTNMGSPYYDAEIVSAPSSRLSSVSEMVKKRDKYVCQACGKSFVHSNKATRSQLEAAHILDVEEEEAAKKRGGDAHEQLLNSVGLLCGAQDCNLVSLCYQCHHDYFDKNMICINYNEETRKYFWEVKESAADDDFPDGNGKYGDIQDKEIKFLFNSFPPPQLIEHRMADYRAGKKKRKFPALKVS
jgi:5-methylcytosine-specific restriction endonuclease McrA